MTVLVAGESLVDVVSADDGSLTEHPGGSPANVAVTLARLGTRVRLLTAFAHDSRGELIEAYLDEPGLELAADPYVVERTSSAVATLGPDGAATYAFDISGVLPEPDLAVLPAHLHLGSLGALLPPGADLLARLVDRLRPTATVSYDINARPTAVPLDAAVRQRIEALVARSDVVKASDEDLAAWAPELSVTEAATRLLELGAGAVVVTLGARGARCYTSEGVVAEVPAEPVTVQDTIGAGDVFCATMLDTWLRSSKDWTQILRRASRAAAVTVSRSGASAPTAAELDG